MASAPFKVKALFEYSSPHDDDLTFPVGQIITVTAIEDDDWYFGEYDLDGGSKNEGIFPRNFVEKYEPVAPPRPTRSRPKKDAEPPASPPPEPEPSDEPEPNPSPTHHDPVLESDEEGPASSHPPPPLEPQGQPEPVSAPMGSSDATHPPIGKRAPPEETLPPEATISAPPILKPADPAPAPPASTKPGPPQQKPGPPPVAGKPTSSAFKDRIAAFNKPAAPPVTPFKPSGLGSGSAGFIKKPFVAPPPSRNAFVPTNQNAPPPAKIYRRDEDPEVKEQESEIQENAEKVGLTRSSTQDIGDAGEKPMSLKERLALLQKQQLETAQRHAEAAARKEKPKRPPKKRLESHDIAPAVAEDPVPGLERQDTQETVSRAAIDEPVQRMPPPKRKPSKGTNEDIQDGNEADMSGAGDTTEGPDELTEREGADDKLKKRLSPGPAPPARQQEEEPKGDENEGEEEGEEEEDDVDPEIRRKEELRARMAKISGGGMGMGGMFGMPMPMMGGPPHGPPKKKKAELIEEAKEEDIRETAAPVPIPAMVALPAMSASRPPQPAREPHEEMAETTAPSASRAPAAREIEEEEESRPETSQDKPPPESSTPGRDDASPPQIPGGRPAPPPVPSETRPPPPPPPVMQQVSEGSESDDELSEHPETKRQGFYHATRAPPPPPVSVPAPPAPASPRSPPARRRSYVGDETSPGAPGSSGKRTSRPPRPTPSTAPMPPPAVSRPPPPPPPEGTSRASTIEMSTTTTTPQHTMRPEDEDEEVTEYEGDYDTDIASSVPHKDALKSHARVPSYDDNTPTRSPASEAPAMMPPPPPPPPIPSSDTRRRTPPPVTAPEVSREVGPSAPAVEALRGVPPPPPIPSQPPPARASIEISRAVPPPHPTRASFDMPRAAPPPPPPPKEATPRYGNDEYDPYNYSTPTQGITIPGFGQPATPTMEPAPYSPEQPLSSTFPSAGGRAAPPVPSSGRSSHRQSFDAHRAAMQGKRSMDASRPSVQSGSGYCANDIDLAQYSNWWQHSNTLPPALQGRKDIHAEFEEQAEIPGSQHTVTRDVYVLYQDYSQTVITVSYAVNNASDVEIEQRHEAPPRSPRQDELETIYEKFGRVIANAVKERKDSVVGDGTPQGLVMELLKPLKNALFPVGSRAYGALVYQNIANTFTQTHDEIRPGDIISIRNAKFQGKHGPMHAKYSVEIGKPDHVGIVAEWDGTKKKVRAWEQGRENKKCKVESFKLEDLRSGEVKIWRVMPRSWVNWDDRS